LLLESLDGILIFNDCELFFHFASSKEDLAIVILITRIAFIILQLDFPPLLNIRQIEMLRLLKFLVLQMILEK